MNSQRDKIRIPNTGSGSLDDQAEEWLAYLHSGAATDVGRGLFSKWLRESDDHAAAYQSAEQLWGDLLSAGAVGENGPEIFDPQLREDRQTQASLASSSIVKYAVAASVLLVVASLLVLGMPEQDTTQIVHYETAAGEIRSVNLPDGSKITVGADSALTVTMSGRSRQVDLSRGGAYFDVSSDPSRPFVTVAGQTAITVVGTSFDVLSSQNGVRVSVTEGVVNVGRQTESGPVPETGKSLVAGEQVVANLNGIIGETRRFKERVTLAWLEGRLVYVDVPLEEVIADVNRYRQKKIVLQDSSMGELHVTLSTGVDQTDQLLASLQALLQTSVDEGPFNVLLGPKAGIE